MRMIDADAELKKLDEMEIEGATFVTAVSFAKLVLLNAPTVDTQSVVRHGNWIHDGLDIPHGIDWMHCSECGKRDKYCPATMTNYCPNCGARMDGNVND